MKGRVSVCICTFNRKGKLKRTVESVLAQTYRDLEVIIVDDCSTDGTEEFVKEFITPLDSRLKYFKHEKNRGLAVARNTAINNAEGEYFTFVDDDDLWAPSFIREFLSVAIANDKKTIYSASKISNRKSGLKSIDAPLIELLKLGYTPPVGSQFYRLNDLKLIGGYDTRVVSGVDHDLWITLAANDFNIRWINKPLVKVNQQQTTTRMTFDFTKRLKYTGQAIALWESKYSNEFGPIFFERCSQNYRYNTFKKMLLSDLKRLNAIRVLKTMPKIPIRLFILDVKRYLLAKFHPPLLMHPTFFASVSGLEYKEKFNKVQIRW